jgi:hypothetical protein
VDSRLDQNEAELGVLVLAVALEVLADGNGLIVQCVSLGSSYGGEGRKEPVCTFLMSM